MTADIALIAYCKDHVLMAGRVFFPESLPPRDPQNPKIASGDHK